MLFSFFIGLCLALREAPCSNRGSRPEFKNMTKLYDMDNSNSVQLVLMDRYCNKTTEMNHISLDHTHGSFIIILLLVSCTIFQIFNLILTFLLLYGKRKIEPKNIYRPEKTYSRTEEITPFNQCGNIKPYQCLNSKPSSDNTKPVNQSESITLCSQSISDTETYI